MFDFFGLVMMKCSSTTYPVCIFFQIFSHKQSSSSTVNRSTVWCEMIRAKTRAPRNYEGPWKFQIHETCPAHVVVILAVNGWLLNKHGLGRYLFTLWIFIAREAQIWRNWFLRRFLFFCKADIFCENHQFENNFVKKSRKDNRILEKYLINFSFCLNQIKEMIFSIQFHNLK